MNFCIILKINIVASCSPAANTFYLKFYKDCTNYVNLYFPCYDVCYAFPTTEELSILQLSEDSWINGNQIEFYSDGEFNNFVAYKMVDVTI